MKTAGWIFPGCRRQEATHDSRPGEVVPRRGAALAAAHCRKFDFYDRYGVDEYYLYDPDHAELFGWLRRQGHLRSIPQMHAHVSPRLGVRFDLSPDGLVIIRPDR